MVVDGERIEPDYTLVPRLQVQASAGPGAVGFAEEQGQFDDPGNILAFRRDWLRRIGVAPQAARALTARGDSMEPTIHDGDILLADTSVEHIVDNGIYVLVLAGLLLLKRVHPTRDGSVTLISDNPLYPQEIVPVHEIPDLVVAGRIRWFGRSI
jgi:phage repressor protein C with HTH and peptisase S24 domain